MPELPEVETVRRTLLQYLPQRLFTGAVIDWPQAIAYPSEQHFVQTLRGQEIHTLTRRGKYLIFHLDSGAQLVIHFRMTGSLQLWPQEAPLPRFTRNRLLLDRDQELRFIDVRKFGQLWLVMPGEENHLPYLALGPEPLTASFTIAYFAEQLGRSGRSTKATLLDQRIVAGLGNIYVDEALWEAHLHPEAPANRLTLEEVSALHRAVQMVLERGIANLGTSYRDFVGPCGQRGLNQEELRVWARTGQPCPRCGTPIHKLRSAGRGTHICPFCQRYPCTDMSSVQGVP
jgi:formamidopyrimidine-DNA glycosylase